MPVFSREEYLARVTRVKERMEQSGIDLLVCGDAANINYLTGYDGWSFYTPQVVAVALERDEPIVAVRGMDRNGGRVTSWLAEDSLLGYPDHYVQSPDRHPLEWIAGELRARGLGAGRVSIERDSYYLTPRAVAAFEASLPDASFVDGAELLVNWVRVVKSPAEIALMRQAATIVERMMAVAYDAIAPGVRQCDAAAAIYHAQVSGSPEFGGDYGAFPPMMPTGVGTSAPHLTWTDEPFRNGEATILELCGCRHRYHVPQARTLFLGTPPQRLVDTAAVVLDGVAAGLAAVRAGVTAESVEAAWRTTIARHGIEKESRIGYSIGLNYPPDWGERTISLRPGDQTVLREDMTLHLIAGIWQDDWGIEISEAFRVTATGPDVLCANPRELHVRH